MVSKSLLKEIILSNEEFILKHVGKIVEREGIHFPEDLNKVVVFFGVRRSGKTFILFNLFKKYKDRALYIDFEDERLQEFEMKDFETLKEAFFELKPHLLGKEPIFLFDEIQNVKGWERFCRRAVEMEGIRIFVSGSSSKMMPLEINTELRGRAWSIKVMPFSFKEFLHVKGIDIKDKRYFYTSEKAIVKKYFWEYMNWGGFPEVSLSTSEFDKRKILKEYMGAMFFRDLVERYKIRNISLLDILGNKLFSSFSSKFSLNSFYNQYKDKIPFSKDLLFKYYKYFLQSMLVFEVRKFTESSYKRMRNPAKIYLVDTGLAKRVSSFDLGRLLENIVFLEFEREGCEFFYFEGKGECDFLLKCDNKLNPVQVCFELTDKNREREINGILEVARLINAKEGKIITFDKEEEIAIGNVSIKIVPAWKWRLV